MSRLVKIVGDSAALSLRQVAVLALTLGQTVFVARALGPAAFGTYALVSVLAMIAAVAGPGFLPAAGRELPHWRGLGDRAREATVLAHTTTGELATAALWSVVILGAAAWQAEGALRLYLALTAAAVIPARIVALYQLVAYAEKEFIVQARVELLRAAVTTGATIALVRPFGLAAVFVAPLLGHCAAIAAFSRVHRLPFVVRGAERREFARLAAIGLPIAGLNVVSGNAGLQRWLERSLLHWWLGPAALGLYSFCAWIAVTVLGLIGGLVQALQPHLYELMSGELDRAGLDRYLLRPIWTLSVAAALGLGLLACVLPDLLLGFLPEYAAALPTLLILLGATAVCALYWIPGVLLNSARIDGQAAYLAYWCAAIATSVAAAAALFAVGAGIEAVAVGYLLSQLVVCALTFRHLGPYLFAGPDDRLEFAGRVAGPLGWAACSAALAHGAWRLAGPAGGGAWGSVLAACGKGMIFAALSTPTFRLVERKTGLYRRFVGAAPAEAGVA